MLKQLVRLNIEADGRYATDQELKFLEDYLQSVEKRVSAYEKIRDAEEKIIDQVKARLDAKNPNLFMRNSQDSSDIWRRDINTVLRCSTFAMLINDLDGLRDRLLLWHRTLMTAYKCMDICELAFEELPEVIKQFLTPAEAELIMPVLQLKQSILRS